MAGDTLHNDIPELSAKMALAGEMLNLLVQKVIIILSFFSAPQCLEYS
jgi:hypothetical protein